jgi:hypothetical protein
VADHTPGKVIVESVQFGRYAPRIERGIYYCCLEALQNSVKHAGPSAIVRIRLVGETNRVSFSVGRFRRRLRSRPRPGGAGFVNLADRVDVMGGHLSIDSLPGHGDTDHGEIPVEPGPSTEGPAATSLSPTPARSDVRAWLGAGVDVGACREVCRIRGEPDRGGPPGAQGAVLRPLTRRKPCAAGQPVVRASAARRRRAPDRRRLPADPGDQHPGHRPAGLERICDRRDDDRQRHGEDRAGATEYHDPEQERHRDDDRRQVDRGAHEPRLDEVVRREVDDRVGDDDDHRGRQAADDEREDRRGITR